MNYEELVKALRYCAESGDFNCNKDCPMYPNYPKCLTKMDMDAAAAIEDMAKHITEMHERVTVLQIARGELEAEVKRLEPKRGEWIDRYDEDDKPFFKRKYVCSACGGWNTYGKSKYCPKCGAKMEPPKEEE